MIQQAKGNNDAAGSAWESADSESSQCGPHGVPDAVAGARASGELSPVEKERDELRRMNNRLAEVSAESAELMAALEDRNDDLNCLNRQIARANAHAAELMAEIDGRNVRIHKLNSALARANARASELVAEVEIRKEQLECLLTELRDERQARRLAEDRLVQKQKLEAIGTLAGGVAHEVNNPLMIVLMNAQSLAGAGDSPAAPGLIQGIVESVDRIARVIRGLQSFAESQAAEFRPSRVSEMVHNTLSLLQGNIRDADVRLEVDMPEDLPELNCRPQQIQQVILNLVTNACEAVARDGVTEDRRHVLVRARQTDSLDGSFLRLTVSDTAGALQSEVASRVFDPFFSTKDQVYGAGMGLSVSYRIARDHGGALLLETTESGETRFHLDLPLERDIEGADE